MRKPSTHGEAPFDVVDRIVAYETGETTEEETIELFQHLVDTGQAWTLQGHYGRTAADLIRGGYVRVRREDGSAL